MSRGKGSSKSSRTYDYYGTVAGAICIGPVDSLQSVIIDGKTVVSGPIALTTDATDLTLDPDQESFLRTGGRITIYRGTQTAADPALPDHPAYAGICYLVAVDLLFGRERTTTPNIQVVVTRKPVADTSLVPAINNTLTASGQCSPVAALVEILTAPHALNLPVAALDATSWQAASVWASDLARIQYTHCSPLVTSQAAARRLVLELLTMIDAVLYWTAAGKIAIALLKPGTTPASPLTLDARHETEELRLESRGWPDVPTSMEVRYRDRDSKYKERSVKVDNSLALRLRDGVPSASSADRPHITGADQASWHAAEALRRGSQPIGEMEISIRRPLADGLHPGSKILVDVDPEPGGAGLAQLAVIQEVRSGPTGPVTLRLRPDTLSESVPYSPTWSATTPEAPDCPPIVETSAVVIPLPSATYPVPSIAILAPRPRADVVGMRVYISEDGTEFADLGTQRSFACRAALDADIAAEDEEVVLTLPDGDDGPDAYLAARYPTTAVGAASDEMLLVIADLDVDGKVVITEGMPRLEVCSIQTRAFVDPDMTYTILRARLGTPAMNWTTSAKAWITVGATIEVLSHQVVRGMALTGDVGYIRLVATTGQAEDDTVPIPEREFVMPASANSAPTITVTTPSGSTGTTDGSGNFTAEFHVDDAEGDLVRVDVTLRNSDTGETLRYEQPVLGGVLRYPETGTVSIPIQAVAIGNHELIISAQDRSSPAVTVRRTIYRPVTSGTAVAPVQFAPPGGVRFTGRIYVTVTAASPANQLEWQMTPLGSAGPRIFPGVYPPGWYGIANLAAPTNDFMFTHSVRLWVRAGAGTAPSVTWGGWVAADYTKV